MPELVTLDKDGPLGPAGTRVWVNSKDEPKVEAPKVEVKPDEPTAVVEDASVALKPVKKAPAKRTARKT